MFLGSSVFKRKDSAQISSEFSQRDAGCRIFRFESENQLREAFLQLGQCIYGQVLQRLGQDALIGHGGALE